MQKTVDAQKFTYSIVLVTRNAEGCINSILNVLDQQSVDFNSGIQVVVVDQDSCDGTKNIVSRWIEKYPDNISCIEMENVSTAAARNRGLKEVRGEWLAFFDCDTLIAPDFFQKISQFIERTSYEGPVLVTNWMLHGNGRVLGEAKHSMRCNESGLINILQTPECFISASAGCFFSHSAVQKSGLLFNEKISTSFIGAHFANMLLLKTGSFVVGCIKEAHYLQPFQGRKMNLDAKEWNNSARYRELMLFGYLDLIQQYQKEMRQTPDFLQNLLLNEINEYMQRMLDDDLPYDFGADIDSFFELALLIVSRVEPHRILISPLPNLDLRTRIAILGSFAGKQFSGMPFVIEEIAPGGKEMRIKHWSTHETKYELHQDSGPQPIAWQKRRALSFRGKKLCYEYQCWVPLENNVERWMNTDGEKVSTLCKYDMVDNFERNEVLRLYYDPQSQCPEQFQKFLNNSNEKSPNNFEHRWIFMDRVDKADDNAEHLCRWTMQNHPEQKIHYVLSPRSSDWPRLQREGFPLLPYGSGDHLHALSKAQWLISSHVDDQVIDPMGTRKKFGQPAYKTAFLQHGITMANISRWLNNISLDCMVTSAKPEHEYLQQDHFKLTERELVLAGFPRHDALLRKAKARKRTGRTILVCPTWRESLMRGAFQNTDAASAKEGFYKSDYFRGWNEVLGSIKISELLQEKGYRLLFLPHPETDKFLSMFTPAKTTSILRWTDVKSVQDLLVNCAFAITDYSSLVLDLGFIGTPTVYYQFKETPGYYQQQGRKPGYFDYERDGMGPVVQTFAELETWITDTIDEKCKRPALYDKRADDFYSLRDGENCRRAYEAIISRS